MGELLRLATAGSVDDGKSTLVGRLLYDSKSVLADQLDAIERASADRGLAEPDLSLLVDGLRSEREQGITIDVAYRYFATPRRSFVLADTPGHVQYTRNTVTGASTAQLALLLVDARNGVIEQTRRHAAVAALLGVPRVVLAVNKIDLVGYDEGVYARIADEFLGYAVAVGYSAEAVTAIPVSALAGDNVVTASARTPWYAGPSLLDYLETVPVLTEAGGIGSRFPVQCVLRADGYRGYAGQVAAGVVRVGDEVVVLPGGRRSVVRGIDSPKGTVEVAGVGESVTLLLGDEIDVARGDVIAAVDDPPVLVEELSATVCWLVEKELRAGDRVLVKHGARTVQGMVAELVSRLDEQTLARVPWPASFAMNEIGQVLVRLAEPLPVDDYSVSRRTGSFVLIDPSDGSTLAAGMIGSPLRILA